MPPKKKKQAKNAFYYFLVEFKENAVRSGRVIDSPGFEEEADREWRNLSPTRRLHYEEIAFEKRKKMDGLENKFTTTGVSYAQLQREEMERMRQEEMMIHEIESTVRSLTGNTLKTKVFHFIHVNTYCRLLDGHFLPCEIGIAKFTFENGVKDCYHTIINLECIPTGYFLECQKNSEESHQIPLPPENTLGEWDSEKVLVQIEAFLAENGVFPPVYTLQSNIEAAQDTLTTFASGKDTFRVYPIAKLLFELRNACANEAGGVGFPVLSLAEREFEKDFFNLSAGISCFYHEGMDACQYCSLSIVKRWCFLFASLGCPDLGIPLKPGSHKPRKITLPPAPPEPMTSKTQVSVRKRKKGAPTVEPPPITIIDYSSPKQSSELGNGEINTDCPLAQFGTYIRVDPEESFQNDSRHCEVSSINSYAVHYRNKIESTRKVENFRTSANHTENIKYFADTNSTSFIPTNSKQQFSLIKSDEYRPAIKTIKDEEIKQYNSSNLKSPSYQGLPNEKIKSQQGQKSQFSELYSQFVYDVRDCISQKIEPLIEQAPDVFDIYVDSMFQPVPLEKESPDKYIKSTNLESFSTSWKNSASSFVNKNHMPSGSPQHAKSVSPGYCMNSGNINFACSPQKNRSNSPACVDLSIGHGRGLTIEQEASEMSLVRPGREKFCVSKVPSTDITGSGLHEQRLPRNGMTSAMHSSVPGRGRGRARGLSLLLE